MIDFMKIGKIYGLDVISLIKENADEVKENINYIKNKGLINYSEIFERFAVSFLCDNESFKNKFDKLINNLGDDYINILNEDTSFFEVMV